MSRITYTVKPGDYLGKVAYEILGDGHKWPELAAYNDLVNPHRLEVGQALEIPPWMPRRFRYPLEVIETEYYKFGSIYGPGPHKGKPHPGVDFHEANGARVYAIGEGKVIRIGNDKRGYGHYTMIEHRPGPVWSLYAHLWAPPLHKEGALLAGDDIFIGWEGDTGASGDIFHVHFEIKRVPNLGLYSQLNHDTLTEYWYDPYVFLSDSANVFLPVHCWGCPHRGDQCS